MAAEREMRDFTRGLFQCSPDLSVLTLSMVRTKYLAHVGRESLVPEEKQLLKQLVEEELLTMQLGESSGDEESPTPKSAQDTPEAQAQKRPWHGSNSSGGSPKEMARKKQRLNRDSENSSDGEDSGIDSRKTKLAPARRDAGKCGRARSWEDEGDSGAEETPDRGGSGSDSDSEGGARSQGMKQPPRRRTGEAKGQDQAGKKRARVAEWRGDCREQKGKEDRGTVAQIEEESGSESEVEECKQQEQTGKKGAMKAEQRDDSEEEEGDSKKKGTMKAWGKEARNDSEEERKSRKQGTRKAERRGDSEEEESEGERKSRKKTGKKGARNAEQGSDSEEEESKQRLKAGEEERKSRKQAGKQGVRKTQWRGDSEEEGDSKKKRRRMKARGKESGSDSEEDKEERKGRRQAGKKGVRKAGRWNDSEDEDKNKTKAQRKEGLGCAEERKWQKQMGKKGMGKAERWSDSEDEEGGTKKRRGKESGSESEEERKSRKQAGKQGARKAERRGDSKEEESKQRLKAGEEEEESGSESEGERKSRKETGKKGARKAEQDSNSEEEESKLKAGEEEESGSEREECEVQAKKKGSSKSDGDSSSSSSSSAQGENNSPNHGSRHKKGKAPGEHPAVQRLKRYILACGVRRNYKKLLGTCHSVKERVRVLRRELEAIGLQGNPSLERCRALRQRREEAAEVAALDMGNIIASEGRPRRRNVWSLYSAPPAVPPSPDRKPPAQHPVDWSSLRGIISSDGESD